jgi:hypothetical protein
MFNFFKHKQSNNSHKSTTATDTGSFYFRNCFERIMEKFLLFFFQHKIRRALPVSRVPGEADVLVAAVTKGKKGVLLEQGSQQQTRKSSKS